MMAYIIRRLLYALPILLGVNVLTFVLFFIVSSPDAMARMQLGEKRVTTTAIENWKREHGYDLPLLWNVSARGTDKVTGTLFWQKSMRLFTLDFGRSDAGRDIGSDIRQRMWPSLAIAVPSLLLGLLADISVALLLAMFRSSSLDMVGVGLCVLLLSISSLFYIIGGQFLIAKLLRWVPVSGYGEGPEIFKFVALPVLLGIIAGIGSGVRWYRSIFLDEINKDYVRTARSKGISEARVLWGHVLRNALIPILTGVVVLLPLLFMGSLLTESFFGIPGLGNYTISAINSQDFAVVRVMVFLGSALYMLGLLLTDISYTLVDPRVRLG